ncbi:MAG TPA: GNVR domain-containing protein [Terriglobales bacterium]|nr:GNVR domain-containing protein [Terriglobales bacterium]
MDRFSSDYEDVPIPADMDFRSNDGRKKQRGDRIWEKLWVLWRHRRFLGRLAVVLVVITAAIAFLIPAQYESAVRIMPPEDNHSTLALGTAMLSKAGLPSGLGALAGALGRNDKGALWENLLGSRTVQDHLIDKFDLQRVYWRKYRQDTRKKLGARTDVDEDRKSGVITIKVADTSRERAQQMAQAYVQELDKLLSQVSTSAARREREFIEGRLAKVKEDLNTTSKQFSQFAAENMVPEPREQTRAMVNSAAELQAQLMLAQSELEALRQTYKPDNIRVRTVQARINSLRDDLRKLGGSADADEKSTVAELYPPLRRLPGLSVNWADYYRRVRVQETLFELLTQQYELASIDEAKAIPSVRVIDPASWPEKKSWPPRLLIILAGTLLGMAAASYYLLAREKWASVDGSDKCKLLVIDVANTVASRARAWRHWRKAG